MDTTEKFTAISVCFGLRGIETGVGRVLGETIQVSAYVEIEAFIIENLLAGMEAGLVDAAPIWANAKTFPYREFYQRIHFLFGGYPCPPFSFAGKRKGSKDPRHLWPYLYRIAQSVRPLCCFFENVEGHLNLGFEEVSRDLRKLGYKVEGGLYSAQEVGAPHRRKRLFILAILGNAQSNDKWNDFICSGHWKIKTRRTSKKLADAYCNGYRAESGRLINQGKSIKGASQGENSHKVEPWNQSRIFNQDDQNESHKFPAGPGQQQYEWEHPRTIEPGMGCTINGYNFREDLLRALGNSVVEQTAELAFRELLKKHNL